MRALVALLACSVVFAGCSSPSQPGGAEDDGLGLEAESGLGVIRGVVVDAAIVPVAGIKVIAAKDGRELSTLTTDEGLFGFSNMEPGIHVVRTQSDTYVDAQSLVPVEADALDPPFVKLTVEVIASRLPYVSTAQFDGYMQCGVRGATGNVQACRIGNDFGGQAVFQDETRFEVDIDAGPRWVQWEMAWSSTQPLGDRMGFGVTQIDGEGNHVDGGLNPHNMGASPLMLHVDEAGAVVCENGCGERVLNMTRWDLAESRALAGGLEETEPPVAVCSPTGSPCLEEFGVVLEQEYQQFFHAFYNAVAPLGWRFTADGAPALE